MIRNIPYTTDSKAVYLGLRARGAVAKAKEFGFDLNPETGEMSAHCNRCDTYAVLPDSGMLCKGCIDDMNNSEADLND
jgi:hypothetical protein